MAEQLSTDTTDPISGVKSAYYSEPTGTAENAWNDALQHIEEGLLERPLGVAQARPACKSACDGQMQLAMAEIERVRAAIFEIQKATLEGRVCADVAWFDGTTTLHDFCDFILNGPDDGSPWSSTAAPAQAVPTPLSAMRALALAQDALEQAQDCINGETPEDMSREDAREDTIRKIREALRALSPLASTGRCICQDQHRRGHCTEPGCPYAMTSPHRETPPHER